MPDADSIKDDIGVNIEVCQCSGCGLVQLSNDPVPYYREVIRASAFSEEMKAFRMKQFANFITKHSLSGKKVIEIGCGRGEYLSLIQQLDVDVYGIEYSEQSAIECARNGLNVKKGFIEHTDYEIENAPFDAFFILNYLEHLPNPNTALRGLWKNLNDGAVGLVEVPNFDMIVQKGLFSEFIADHLFYFTKETLNFVLFQNGFEIIECKTIWKDYIISASVEKRKKLDITRFYTQKINLERELKQFLNNFRDKSVAIWGAGHQAFTVIALTGISLKIKYIIDSAKFKHGKYSPITHIPIVPPKALISDPVSAVIIMAAGYSDEVKNIIRNRYSVDLELAILRDFGLEIV